MPTGSCRKRRVAAGVSDGSGPWVAGTEPKLRPMRACALGSAMQRCHDQLIPTADEAGVSAMKWGLPGMSDCRVRTAAAAATIDIRLAGADDSQLIARKMLQLQPRGGKGHLSPGP